MGNMLEELIRRSQEKIKNIAESKKVVQNNNITSQSDNISQRPNLMDFIKKSQEERINRNNQYDNSFFQQRLRNADLKNNNVQEQMVDNNSNNTSQPKVSGNNDSNLQSGVQVPKITATSNLNNYNISSSPTPVVKPSIDTDLHEGMTNIVMASSEGKNIDENVTEQYKNAFKNIYKRSKQGKNIFSEGNYKDNQLTENVIKYIGKYGTDDQKIALKRAMEETNNEIKKDKGSLFQLPESFKDNLDLFDDGYQFGDITRTGLRYVGDTAGAALGTVADTGLGLVKGVANIGGAAADLAGAGIAGVMDWAGNKKGADRLRKIIASGGGHYASDLIGGLQKDIDKYSFVGDKGDQMTENIGYMGVLAVTGGAGKAGKIASNCMMFASGADGGLREAYAKGATGFQALAKAVQSGSIEMFTENLFGMCGNVDTKFINGITGKINSKVGQIIVRNGLNATGEATEEVTSAVLDYVLDRAIDYIEFDDKGIKFSEDIDWDEVLAEAELVAGSTLIMGGRFCRNKYCK